AEAWMGGGERKILVVQSRSVHVQFYRRKRRERSPDNMYGRDTTGIWHRIGHTRFEPAMRLRPLQARFDIGIGPALPLIGTGLLAQFGTCFRQRKVPIILAWSVYLDL